MMRAEEATLVPLVCLGRRMVFGGQAPLQRSCPTGAMAREQGGMTFMSRGTSLASLPVFGRLALVLPIINNHDGLPFPPPHRADANGAERRSSAERAITALYAFARGQPV